jgi:4-hydroxybenzoate polyprenyltransferase/phosphoserine phosphatase
MNDVSLPVCVDLDQTLTRIDPLHESILSLIRKAPLLLLSFPLWLRRGRATFKQEIASRVQIDAASLPYRSDVLDLVKAASASGRRVILSTRTPRPFADAIAAHLGLFNEVLATEGEKNMQGENKRLALVERFGEKGFDFVGDRSDAAVWRSARKAIVVGSKATAQRVGRVAEVIAIIRPRSGLTRAWIRAMRPHQWAKNALTFLPALLAHRILNPHSLAASLWAFLAFCLCASSVYIVNDLFDLASDRQHPRKRLRPFAAGVLSARSGVIGALLLLVGAVVIANQLDWRFGAVLGGYYALTWAYSLRLKREALLDVMTLAGLYTIRIIAGAAATGIALSFWMLAFSVFMFLSLAMVKRYTELNDLRVQGSQRIHGRGYSADDLPLLMAFGVVSGFSSILVTALYVNSPESLGLYHHHKRIWLICPLMLYWISRVWLLTIRREMHDDPLVFALRDRVSLLILATLGAIVLISI